MQQNIITTSTNKPSTSAVEAAAMEAAVADGLITANGLYTSDEKAKKSGLRRGKWTAEEEFYANRLIYEFKLGLLPLTDGTTLRTFLSKLLNCDPMRISKKFVGQNCIGKVRALLFKTYNLSGSFPHFDFVFTASIPEEATGLGETFRGATRS